MQKAPYQQGFLHADAVGNDYRALSAIIVEAESVAIVVVSVDMSAVESTPASSVFGLAWQAASVNRLPTSRNANTFFMSYKLVVNILIDILLQLFLALFGRP